jgi:hypothetical protein
MAHNLSKAMASSVEQQHQQLVLWFVLVMVGVTYLKLCWTELVQP